MEVFESARHQARVRKHFVMIERKCGGWGVPPIKSRMGFFANQIRLFLTTETEPPVRSTIAPGCVFALASALVTCLLLFVNGSLALAFLKALAKSGSGWAHDPRLMQFVLLFLPVILVVIEWAIFDYVRRKVWRR